MATKKAPAQRQSNSKSVWVRTPTPNLIRYTPKGTYYLRARFSGGEPIRESLGTTKYRIAVIKLADRMRELRALNGSDDDAPETLHAALRIVRAQVEANPRIKSSTRQSHLKRLDCLVLGAPAEVPGGDLVRLSAIELGRWWSRTADLYSPQWSNHLLMFVKRALRIARKAGVMASDPSEDLKPMRIPATRVLVTTAQLASLIDSIRTQRSRWAEASANWVAFVAYSGLRAGEMMALTWADIKDDHIVVHGGKEGTKNHKWRPVPIIGPMRELLTRMRNGQKLTEPVLKRYAPPREALRNACARLGLPRLRIHDLRHLFATACTESGVDVPTFSRWLGHSDGGALAMRVYVHPHTEHSRRQAEKVTFNRKEP